MNHKEKILKKEGSDLEQLLAKQIFDLEIKSDGKTKEYYQQLYILSAEKLEYKDRAN